MFYGWGRSSRGWQMSDGRTVVAVSSYLSVMFIPLFLCTKWLIVGDVRSQDVEVPQSHINATYGDEAPSINIFSRFGLLFAIGAIMLFGSAVFGALFG